MRNTKDYWIIPIVATLVTPISCFIPPLCLLFILFTFIGLIFTQTDWAPAIGVGLYWIFWNVMLYLEMNRRDDFISLNNDGK